MMRRQDREEFIRRMGEPEPYRTLRLQKERIEAEQERAAQKAMYDRMAEDLRREIAALGYKLDA